MTNKRLLNWADQNIKAECYGQFLDYGFNKKFLINSEDIDTAELFLEFESEVEEVLEEEAIRLKLDRSTFLEYNQENEADDSDEVVREYKERAFESAVVVAARRRRDSD